MARRKLTEKEKETMQEARIKTRQERVDAEKALKNNSQFTNPKFWKNVSPGMLDAVDKAIQKARKSAKQAKIAKLEAELAELKGEE